MREASSNSSHQLMARILLNPAALRCAGRAFPPFFDRSPLVLLRLDFVTECLLLHHVRWIYADTVNDRRNQQHCKPMTMVTNRTAALHLHPGPHFSYSVRENCTTVPSILCPHQNRQHSDRCPGSVQFRTAALRRKSSQTRRTDRVRLALHSRCTHWPYCSSFFSSDLALLARSPTTQMMWPRCATCLPRLAAWRRGPIA